MPKPFSSMLTLRGIFKLRLIGFRLIGIGLLLTVSAFKCTCCVTWLIFVKKLLCLEVYTCAVCRSKILDGRIVLPPGLKWTFASWVKNVLQWIYTFVFWVEVLTRILGENILLLLWLKAYFCILGKSILMHSRWKQTFAFRVKVYFCTLGKMYMLVFWVEAYFAFFLKLCFCILDGSVLLWEAYW